MRRRQQHIIDLHVSTGVIPDPESLLPGAIRMCLVCGRRWFVDYNGARRVGEMANVWRRKRVWSVLP